MDASGVIGQRLKVLLDPVGTESRLLKGTSVGRLLAFI